MHAHKLAPETQHLLERIQAAWQELEHLVSPLSEEQLARRPSLSWSIKDHLAHLQTWDRYLLQVHLQGVSPSDALGLEEGTLEGLSEDGINQAIFERNRDRPAKEITEAWCFTHAQLIDLLQEMPAGELLQPADPERPQSASLMNVVEGYLVDHYQEHSQAIRRLLEQAAGSSN